MNSGIKYYIYLDEDGINRIYSQLPNIEIPTKTTTTESLNGMLNPEIGSDGLSKILPVKLSVKLDAAHKIQEEYETTVSSENKVDFILKHVIQINTRFTTMSYKVLCNFLSFFIVDTR